MWASFLIIAFFVFLFMMIAGCIQTANYMKYNNAQQTQQARTREVRRVFVISSSSDGTRNVVRDSDFVIVPQPEIEESIGPSPPPYSDVAKVTVPPPPSYNEAMRQVERV